MQNKQNFVVSTPPIVWRVLYVEFYPNDELQVEKVLKLAIVKFQLLKQMYILTFNTGFKLNAMVRVLSISTYSDLPRFLKYFHQLLIKIPITQFHHVRRDKF